MSRRQIFNFYRCQQMIGSATKLTGLLCSCTGRFLLIAAMAATGTAKANQTVYLCEGVYTDQPCKDGREVDILPTEGADKLSGKSRRSAQAHGRDTSRMVDQSIKKGFADADKSMRCEGLIRERKAIDRSGGSDKRRFEVRQEQFAWKCPRQ